MPNARRWAIAGAAALLILLVPAAALAAPTAGTPARGATPGAVFTMTNGAAGNAVLAFDVGTGGALIPAGHFATHGLGTGASLADQGAVVLSATDQWLFVVNGGSDTVSTFSVNTTPSASPILTYVGQVGAHGVLPVSLTVHGAWVYVLDAGNATVAGNIAGFRIATTGALTLVPGSVQPLSTAASAGPAEIAFTPRGTALLVTEKTTSVLDSYPVSATGVAGTPASTASNGSTPYGFAFTPSGVAVVSDAGPGALSSYSVTHAGAVGLVSGSVGDNQSAPCWVAISLGGRVAFTTNAHSNSISTFDVSRAGALTLAASVGATTAVGPTDLAVGGPAGGELFVLATGAGEIEEFAIGAHGTLVLAFAAAHLPATVEGLAAY